MQRTRPLGGPGDPEVRSAWRPETSGPCLGIVRFQGEAERGEGCLVEADALLQLRDVDSDVVEHWLLPCEGNCGIAHPRPVRLAEVAVARPPRGVDAPDPMGTTRELFRGDGLSVVEHVCAYGPGDRPFEEWHRASHVAFVVDGAFDVRAPGG